MTRTGIAISVFALGSAVSNGFAQPNARGFIVETYAELCEPVRISFNGEGFLYAGNGGCGAGNGSPAWVRRIAPGGSPVENWGDSQIRDPDVVLADDDGLYSGVPGSVLVGTGATGGPAIISAILPDETIITVFEPGVPGNPSNLKFDSTGRLLIMNLPGGVWWTTGGDPQALFDLPAVSSSMAIAPDDKIYTSTEDGVIRIHNADGSIFDGAFATGLGIPVLLVFGPGGTFGTNLYAISNGSLLRFDKGGTFEVIGTGFPQSARDLAFGPARNLYISLPTDDAILRVSPVCSGDINGDGTVGTSDLLILLAEWGVCDGKCFGDLNEDGVVSVGDLFMLLSAWGPCP